MKKCIYFWIVIISTSMIISSDRTFECKDFKEAKKRKRVTLNLVHLANIVPMDAFGEEPVTLSATTEENRKEIAMIKNTLWSNSSPSSPRRLRNDIDSFRAGSQKLADEIAQLQRDVSEEKEVNKRSRTKNCELNERLKKIENSCLFSCLFCLCCD